MAAVLRQVMLQTSRFVGAEGPQLELVLRVRQGQNAAFSFLKPDSPLHGYYRWLVNAQPQASDPCCIPPLPQSSTASAWQQMAPAADSNFACLVCCAQWRLVVHC